MQTLLEAVRKASLAAVWSQGVKLARESAVTRVSSGKGEITLRVRGPGYAVAPTVTLYVEGLEWSCDCGGKVDPCAHVTAAVISAAAAGPVRDGPRRLPRTSRPASYRLDEGEASDARTIHVHGDGREERWAGTLGPLACPRA
jgi:uncharacterized Zn finger protein